MYPFQRIALFLCLVSPMLMTGCQGVSSPNPVSGTKQAPDAGRPATRKPQLLENGTTGALAVSSNYLTFNAVGQSQELDIYEKGYSGGFGIYNPCLDVDQSTQVASWSSSSFNGPMSTVTVTAKAMGSCVMQIYDSNTPRNTIYVPVRVASTLAAQSSIVRFAGTGQQKSFNFSDPGYTGAFGITNPCTGPDNKQVVTWSFKNQGPNVEATLTSVNPGTCVMQIYDSQSPPNTIYVPVQVGSVGTPFPVSIDSLTFNSVSASAQKQLIINEPNYGSGFGIKNPCLENDQKTQNAQWFLGNDSGSQVNVTVRPLNFGTCAMQLYDTSSPESYVDIPVTVNATALSASVSSVMFNNVGGTQQFTISEPGYTGAFGITNPCKNLDGKTILSWSTPNDAGPTVPWTLTAQNAGSCVMQIWDNSSPRKYLYVPVFVAARGDVYDPPGGTYPYFPGSPNVTQIPASVVPDPKSSAWLAYMLPNASNTSPPIHALQVSNGTMQNSVFSDSGEPIYTGAQSQSVGFACTRGCTNVPNGTQVNINQNALPQNGPTSYGDADHHYAIVDQASGFEYDLETTQWPFSNGVLTGAYGGRCSLTTTYSYTNPSSQYSGCSSTASHIPLSVGQIRVSDLFAALNNNSGTLPYAISLNSGCVWGFTLPATAEDQMGENASASQCAPYGARFYINLHDSDINGMSNLTAIERVIARTLDKDHYGGFFIDKFDSSGQGNASLVLGVENDLTYTSFGEPGPWVTQFVPEYNREYSSDPAYDDGTRYYMPLNLGSLKPYFAIYCVTGNPCPITTPPPS